MTIEQYETCRPFFEGHHYAPVQCVLRWSVDTPLEVTFTFLGDDTDTTWVCARDMLAAALRQPLPVGCGDIQFNPGVHPDSLRMTLTHKTTMTFAFSAVRLRAFVNDTERYIRIGTETVVILDEDIYEWIGAA